MRIKILLALFLFFGMGCALPKTSRTPSLTLKNGKLPKDDLVGKLLRAHPELFDSLLQQNQRWQIRIIYTQIDRKPGNRPLFTHHFFNILPDTYFYPASTVKMPAAVLALQKLKELNLPGLDRETTMVTESAYSGQTSVYNDPTAEDGRPTIAHYIRKIFLVSDNDAFNRLYEFLGQEYFNRKLQQMGFDSVQVVHRLEISLSEDENRHTNPVAFYDTSGNLVYNQPLIKSEMAYHPRHTFLGKGFKRNGKLVEGPFDFSKKNRFSLQDLHSVLMGILFPEAVPSQQRFDIRKEDYPFLYKYMSMKPGESKYPSYDTTYQDAYVKFLLHGGSGTMPDSSIRIFNKVGDAYGFLTDVAYIADFKNKVEFILSASIACNSDGIFNDNRYDYEEVGFPFLKNLGNIVYQYELQRKRKRKPDLSEFIFDYRN